MRFWLDMGVDGMRLDAIPYLIEREGTNSENLPETHAVLKQHPRASSTQHYPNRMLLAEANQWPDDVRAYFGDGDECHMAFHFPLMPRMYMAIAAGGPPPDRRDHARRRRTSPTNCQWAIFLRNHDELTLEMVTDDERDYMYRTYAADPQARINLGIRRRLAPLMGNSRRRIELLNSLLLSMPGTPILYYGDEIGMGDNIYLGDRNGVRTPMQWSPRPQRRLLARRPAAALPAADHGPGLRLPGDQRRGAAARPVVAAQLDEADASRVRKRTRRSAAARSSSSSPGNRKVLAYLREYEDESDPVRRQPLALARSRSSSTCARSRAASRSSCSGARRSRRSASCRTSSRCRRTGSTGSSSPRTPTTRMARERPNFDFPVLVIPGRPDGALSRRDPAATDLSALIARRVREQLERHGAPVRSCRTSPWFAVVIRN